MTKMVTIQITPQSAPSPPSWLGEVAAFAQVLTYTGLLKTIQDEVRFARARFGRYDLIDFGAVLIGYILSGEPTLLAFYERLAPFASPFMALFGRDQLPHRSTLSRFLATLDQPTVEALRTLFHKDLLARKPFPSLGGLLDRTGGQWVVIDVDGTRQTARQRALPQADTLPAPHHRFDQVCAPGYTGRKRGEVVRTRTVILQTHTHQFLGIFGNAGNGDYRGERLCCKDKADLLGWSQKNERGLCMTVQHSFKWRHFEVELILLCVRWYLRSALSYRDLEEIMLERGLHVDHTTIYLWVQRYASELEKRCRPHLKTCNDSWKGDETSIKIKKVWFYLYRAVDSEGCTLEFLLRPTRDAEAATHFFLKALRFTADGGPQAHPVEAQMAQLTTAVNSATSIPRVINVDKNAAYVYAVGPSSPGVSDDIEPLEIQRKKRYALLKRHLH
ncbi:hypothetical protein KSZ_05890 [Dictyobacter formicarum]|uniref:DDE domain-containing protein n=1 Tax=Dictyobacter formicarum TaxID=2778368 RepID=A0ABQ3VA87_9CHLR|nr:hypothetical protein KSZ_05890 [Dictyobacter formicarum]